MRLQQHTFAGPRGPPRVLLADDHGDCRCVAAAIEEAGCVVEIVRDARAAIRRAVASPKVTVVVARLRTLQASARLVASLRAALPTRRVRVLVVAPREAGPPRPARA